MAWTIEYTDTAEKQLGKLDKQMARRIVDYMNERVAGLDDPRDLGEALTGPIERALALSGGRLSRDLRYSESRLGNEGQPSRSSVPII